MLNAEVSWRTLNTLVPKLHALGIIIQTRKIDCTTLYKINQQNLTAKHFITLYDNIILQSLDKHQQKIEIIAQ